MTEYQRERICVRLADALEASKTIHDAYAKVRFLEGAIRSVLVDPPLRPADIGPARGEWFADDTRGGDDPSLTMDEEA